MFFNKEGLIKFLQKIGANDNPALTEVNFSKVETRWDYTKEQASWVVDALVKNIYIHKVNLECCPIGDEGAIKLARAWTNRPTMTEANLSYCEIGHRGAATLIYYSQLTVLNLSYNKGLGLPPDHHEMQSLNKRLAALSSDKYSASDDDDLLALEEEMSFPASKPRVQYDAAVPDLWTALGNNQSLIVLKLDRISMPTKDLATSIKQNIVLQQLHLDGCDITGDNIAPLMTALQHNATLLTLNLRCNTLIGSSGAEKIASMLTTNATLIELNLQFCNILNKGALVLANTLLTNKSLKELHLGYNKMDVIGVKPILEAVGTHPTMEALYLDDNKIDEEGGNAAAELLTKNTPLKKLDLFGVGITIIAVKAMMTALMSHKNLIYIRLSGNKFGNQSALPISQMLAINNTLTEMGLRGCGFNTNGVTILSDGLKRNPSITNIDIDVESSILTPYYNRNKGIAKIPNPLRQANLSRQILREREKLNQNSLTIQNQPIAEVPSLQNLAIYAVAFFKKMENGKFKQSETEAPLESLALPTGQQQALGAMQKVKKEESKFEDDFGFGDFQF